MKKRDLVLIGIVLLAAFLCWLVPFLGGKPEKGEAQLRITVNSEEYGKYPLSQDREICVGDTNVCRIENGSVRMTEASCPDHLCMKQRTIDKDGGSIVCLPNRVVLEVTKARESTGPDAAAY